RFDSAALFFSRAEKIQSLFPQPLLESERLYNNLGVLFYESGNYGQAKNYFEKAAELLSEQNPYYKELYVNYRINIATSLFKLEEYSRADSILQSLLPFNVLTNEVYNNIGLVYLHSALYEKAISYFRKVSYNNRLSVGLSNDIANAFIRTNQIDSAKKYLAEAMTANTKYFKDAPNNNHGLTLKYLGDLAIKQLNNRAALANYQKALHQFYPAFRDTNRLSNPQQYSGVFSYINLFQVLVAKANALKALYKQTLNPHWAKEELAVYRSAFALINYVEHSYDSDGARMFLNKIRYTLHDNPVNVCCALYNRTRSKTYLEQAYFFDQQNKASVLSYNRWNTAPNDRRGRAEKEIKSKLTRLALKADNLIDSTQRRNLARSIRDYEIELGKMQQQKGGNNRASENIPTVVKLQSGLDGTTSIVSYHLSDSVLTCFVIGKTYFDVRYQKLYHGFANDLQTFTKALRGAGEGEAVAAASKRLYTLLMGNVLHHNPERLIIIPENELAYLPFEALQDSGGNYLIQKKAVQYQYATALLSPQKKDFKNASRIAFAPFAAKGFSTAPNELNRLPQSLVEARSGSGTILLDSGATKKAFIGNSSNKDIIHLATHAFAPNSAGNKSFIAFYPSDKNIENAFLYAPEIYDLDLSNTQLVILSACETGAGDLVRGEGIMSISRAFAYAGCPNVITSLW
ncbi:MAG TPA: CHAT domain-containing tetratricopeptide repeat protein, partial [Flavisolibacter sp.]|nr:CHAT domain-containing tetratricopeptide repeat protein [Flavisolibacter sp.]